MRNKAEDLLYWVALAGAPNVGPKRFLALLKEFGSPQRALEASLKDLAKVEDVGEVTARSVKGKAGWKEAEKQVKLFEKSGFGWVAFSDDDYPRRLKQIADPPPFLFIRGDLSPKDESALAIVGSRHSTDYGKNITQRITAQLVKNELTIVSGLATGIDTYAHEAAIDNGGRTVAVLGNGLDIVYPAENKSLAEKIAGQGALVSEFLFGTKPLADNFPKRNRIISGLSLGVIVVEAPAKSGALLTAEFALEQNREVFAVPGNLGKKTSEGTNNLIRQGAKLVTSAKDILEELNLTALVRPKEIPKALPQLPTEEMKIYQYLSAEPVHIDKLATVASLPISQTLGSLTNLELKGLVRQLSGKHYVRA